MKIMNCLMVASTLFWVVNTSAVEVTHASDPVKKQVASHHAVSKKKSRSFHVNMAVSSDWQKLKGIGKKTADRIVNYREKNGSFSHVSDLYKVKGLSSVTMLRLEKNNQVHFIL